VWRQDELKSQNRPGRMRQSRDRMKHMTWFIFVFRFVFHFTQCPCLPAVCVLSRAPALLPGSAYLLQTMSLKSSNVGMKLIGVTTSNTMMPSAAKPKNALNGMYRDLLSIEFSYVCITSLRQGVLEGSKEALQRLERRTATHRKAASKYRSSHRAELAEKEVIRHNKKVCIL
jgi:hypothetical protein